MRLSVSGLVQRMRPGPLRSQLTSLATLIREVVVPSDDRSTARRVALLAFSTRVASALIALGSQALMARWMGEHEYGVFVVVWVAVVLISSFSSLGFQVSPLRFIPQYIESKEDGLLRGIIVGARLYGLASATTIALVGALGLLLFGDHLASYYVMPFFLAAICLPMLAIGEIQDGMARAFSWSGLAFGPTFIYRPLTIIAVMFLALQFGAPATAITAMWASIAACYFISAAQAIGLRRRFRKTIASGPRQYRPVFWIAISLPMFLVEGFYNLMTNVDILVVGALMEPSKAAIYFATVKTLAIVHFVYFAVRAAAANRFSRYHYSGNRAGMEAFIRDTLHWTFWPSLAISLLLLVAGRPLLSLFGPGFVEGASLFFIFIIGLVVRASVGPAESILTMAGQQRVCALIYVCVFALNAALNFLLIPHFGLYGAAIATSTSFIVEAASLAIIVYTRLGFRSWIGFALWRPNRPAEAN